MPDVAIEPGNTQGVLDWVGMSGIAMRLLLQTPLGTETLDGEIDIYVDLTDPVTRGIHMSRLYLLLGQQLELSPYNLAALLENMVVSHRGISSRGQISIRFDYLYQRPALVSDSSGWRRYPFCITAMIDADGNVQMNLESTITYASTCPCSAALSRQYIGDEFERTFAGRELNLDSIKGLAGQP